MPYTDFTLPDVHTRLGVSPQPVDLFPGLQPLPVPQWLQELLARGLRQALLSEKARSEFIVAPILLAIEEICPPPLAIYSGQRLDVDPDKGLTGECDFVLAGTETVPMLRAPLLTILEAKRNDVEGGIGQCVAQMVAARIFNQQAGLDWPEMYGCVTTGETWQFLHLKESVVGIDRRRYYIDNVGGILAMLDAIVGQFHPAHC